MLSFVHEITNEKKKIGIFVFDEVEVLDFAGPFEVFTNTKIVLNRKYNKIKFFPFEVVIISENKKKISTSGGLKIISDYKFKNHPNLDILIIPGGSGTRMLLENKKVIQWIKKHKNIQLLCSVCTGSLLLAKTGLLKNKKATTHKSAYDLFKEISPTTKIVRNKKFVLDTFFTSAGVSTGIDLSLKIVEKFYGKEIAKKTAEYIEYSNL